MNMPTKFRGHVPQSKFANAAKQARAGFGSGNFKKVEGKYDRLKLGEKPIWVRISPDQSYAQRLYNRELKGVIETGRLDADGNIPYPARPWFEYTTHYIPSRKQSFNCSAGADMKHECAGHAIRSSYFDTVRAREEATQMKDSEAFKKAPVQQAVRYSMAVTVLEKIFELPLLDKKGQPRKSKQGNVLTQFVPAPLSGLSPQQIQTTPGAFGHNYHWDFGPMHLTQLGSYDTDLWNFCANCAADLVAKDFHCTECGAVVYSADDGLTGEDLRSMRETAMQCPHCRHEGAMAPLLLCTGCEHPEEGNILAFDLRLRLDVDPTDDKKTTIKLVGHRLPTYEKLFDVQTAERVYQLVYSPLDIPSICAPDSIESQKWKLPEDLKGIDVGYHLKKKAAKPYGSPETEEGDPDQMPFDEGESDDDNTN